MARRVVEVAREGGGGGGDLIPQRGGGGGGGYRSHTLHGGVVECDVCVCWVVPGPVLTHHPRLQRRKPGAVQVERVESAVQRRVQRGFVRALQVQRRTVNVDSGTVTEIESSFIKLVTG